MAILSVALSVKKKKLPGKKAPSLAFLFSWSWPIEPWGETFVSNQNTDSIDWKIDSELHSPDLMLVAPRHNLTVVAAHCQVCDSPQDDAVLTWTSTDPDCVLVNDSEPTQTSSCHLVLLHTVAWLECSASPTLYRINVHLGKKGSATKYICWDVRAGLRLVMLPTHPRIRSCIQMMDCEGKRSGSKRGRFGVNARTLLLGFTTSPDDDEPLCADRVSYQKDLTCLWATKVTTSLQMTF